MLRKLAAALVFLLIIFVLLSYLCSGIFSNYGAKDSRFFQRIGEEIVRPLIMDEARKYVARSNMPEGVAKEIFPHIELDIVDNRQGSGPGVFCGQSVKIMMYGYTEDPRQVFLQRRNGIFVTRIGDRSISKAIDLAVLGMRTGGERSVKIPRTMPARSNFIRAFRPKKREMVFDIGLLEILDYHEFDPGNLLISRSNQGINRTVVCGDRVIFDVAIRKLCSGGTGGVVFEKKEQETIVGRFQMPMAMELGLEGSMLGGKVVVLAPARFMHTSSKDNNVLDLEKFLNDGDMLLITMWPRTVLADEAAEELDAFNES